MQVKIQFAPIRSCILTPLEFSINEELDKLLSFKGTNYFFSTRFQSNQWDGVTRLYNKKKQTFRSGFLFKVVNFLYEKGLQVEVENYPEPLQFSQHSPNYKLRLYQQELVDKILEYRFGVIEAPPRTGKTITAAAVFDSIQTFPSIFYCRSIDLAIQTKRKFEEWLDYKIGMVGDGKFELGDITIVTIQSAYSAYGEEFPEKSEHTEKEVTKKDELKDLITKAKVIFYDEVHHSSGRTSKYVLDKSKDVIMKIGLTATPAEGSPEDIRLEEHIGPIIQKIGYSRLIKEGYLLKPIIYMYKLPKMSIEGNYQSVYKKAVTESSFLNYLVKKIVDNLNALNHSVVIQTEFRNHTQQLAKFLNAPFLIGQESGEKRAKVLQDLRDKKILKLVSTVVEEGIDVPSLSYSINLCGQKSRIATIQRMRSITADEGKTTCGVIDFIHQCKYLKLHSKKRLNVYLSEPEFEVHIRDVSKKSMEDFL